MKCIRRDCLNDAEIHPVYGVIPCSDCQSKDSTTGTQLRYNSINHLDRIQRQRDNHSKDMIQPFTSGKINKDFADAYPELAEDYYTKEELQAL